MKKLSKLLNSRIFVVVMAIFLQVIWMGVFLWKLSSYFKYIDIIVKVLSILMVLWLMNKRSNPAYKLVWMILILTIPIFGVLIYFLFGRSNIARKMEKKFAEFTSDQNAHLKEDTRIRELIDKESREYSNQSAYIRDYGGYPLYGNVESHYFGVGDDMLQAMVDELEKAEHYIFIEYFIIADGYMWRTIRDVLERKAQQGIDVRLIYDDFGCTSRLPRHFYKRLQKKGIKCASFNPLRPIVNIILNNRDHRKILVIDGKVAFTGGINIADEYINQLNRFGHWKDSGIMLKGPAVWSFSSMFLQMWSVVTRMEPEFEKFVPPAYLTPIPEKYKGFIQPYTDIPVDSETVGENVYLNIISHANRYIYIYTPYLIIDNEMMTALCLAAKSGVDIRIVTPEIPDKKSVYLLTQSYYEQLLESGVRIFQYVPGFIHSKVFICDDVVATVGTINLDYRSLYLHFECGAWLFKCEAIEEIKKDMEDTFRDCREITLDFCRNRNIVIRGYQSILRLFAPML
ncbi:MAG: cardiolipin synthase [Lachnospiraceae bacterium]|nr:cardiolipin synthase [Lachnospiraceae bacterium]